MIHLFKLLVDLLKGRFRARIIGYLVSFKSSNTFLAVCTLGYNASPTVQLVLSLPSSVVHLLLLLTKTIISFTNWVTIGDWTALTMPYNTLAGVHREQSNKTGTNFTTLSVGDLASLEV